jgi:spore coat polysaccharide biosynthesis protein SpsF
MSNNDYNTEQEAFWAGSFGDEYIDRNKSEQLLASNLNFFSTCLKHAGRMNSCIEFGANIGMNLKALKMLYPGIAMQGVEINKNAAKQLEAVIESSNIHNCSIVDASINTKCDLSFIKGVLIHINPEHLNQVYDKLYEVSNKFILVAEYYNPSPVAIPYRGHMDRLFKRDFAGEMLDRFQDLQLIDYGFAYRKDPAFPQDDITWFLMRKNN